MGYKAGGQLPCGRCGTPTEYRVRKIRMPQCPDCGVYFAEVWLRIQRSWRWAGIQGQLNALAEFDARREAESPYWASVSRETVQSSTVDDPDIEIR